MGLMRGYLNVLLPSAEVVVATSLVAEPGQEHSETLEALGARLAKEVNTYILRFCPLLALQGVLSSSPQGPSSSLGSNGHYGQGGGVAAAADEQAGGRRGWFGRAREQPVVGTAVAVEERKQGRLSFVCFSMGGLVVRYALQQAVLAPFASRLHCYVSLACPHLGQASSPSIVKTGTWALRKVTGSKILHELDLQDASDPLSTTLYRQSRAGGLERFRSVVLVSNPQDGLVAVHSALVQVRPPQELDTSANAAAAAMARNLLDKMDETRTRVVRVLVDYEHQAKGTLDSMIGRAGHLCFIDSPQVEMLVSGQPEVDMDYLREHTEPRGFSASDPLVQSLWRVLGDLSGHERSQFIRFVWGRSRLPQRGRPWPQQFKVHRLHGCGEEALPETHTCSFSIEIPGYSCEAVLRRRLLTAINFDVGGILNA